MKQRNQSSSVLYNDGPEMFGLDNNGRGGLQTMTTATRFEPLPVGRAREIQRLLRETGAGSEKGLALDGEGRVTGVVDLDDPQPEHVLGDFDVHA